MRSLRSKSVKMSLRLSKSLAIPINSANLTERRQAFAKLDKFFPVSRSVKIQSVKTAGFKGEWITVPESRAGKVVLYFPGGGFVLRTNVHRDLISRLSREARAKALSVHYSLSPEQPYPAALHDALAAYKWLFAQGFGPEDIVVAGDSAGGALTLSLLHRLKKDRLPLPACAVVIAPPTDATLGSPSIAVNQSKDFLIKPSALGFFIKAYFGNTATNDPIASPLHGSFKGFPPLLVHIDKDEILYGDSAMLVEKARKQGVDVEFYEAEGLWHVWHLFARYIPEAREAIKQIGAFVRSNLG